MVVLTEPCVEVVEDGPDCGLPPESDVVEPVDRDGGHGGEDCERQPLYVLQEGAPGDWGQGLLVPHCPGDVVVWDVEVGGDLLFDGRGLHFGLCGGSGGCRTRLDDRRHGWLFAAVAEVDRDRERARWAAGRRKDGVIYEAHPSHARFCWGFRTA